MLAVIVKHLGARPAGTGIAHRPEIIRGVTRTLIVTDANHALGGYADFLCPDVVSLVIFGIHRDGELVLGQLVDLGQ